MIDKSGVSTSMCVLHIDLRIVVPWCMTEDERVGEEGK